MRLIVTSNNESWPRLIWPTLYSHKTFICHAFGRICTRFGLGYACPGRS